VGRRSGLDDVEKRFLTLPGLELRRLGRPARRHEMHIYIINKISSHITENTLHFLTQTIRLLLVREMNTVRSNNRKKLKNTFVSKMQDLSLRL
jgi:hypothetical protein